MAATAGGSALSTPSSAAAAATGLLQPEVQTVLELQAVLAKTRQKIAALASASSRERQRVARESLLAARRGGKGKGGWGGGGGGSQGMGPLVSTGGQTAGGAATPLGAAGGGISSGQLLFQAVLGKPLGGSSAGSGRLRGVGGGAEVQSSNRGSPGPLGIHASSEEEVEEVEEEEEEEEGEEEGGEEEGLEEGGEVESAGEQAAMEVSAADIDIGLGPFSGRPAFGSPANAPDTPEPAHPAAAAAAAAGLPPQSASRTLGATIAAVKSLRAGLEAAARESEIAIRASSRKRGLPTGKGIGMGATAASTTSGGALPPSSAVGSATPAELSASRLPPASPPFALLPPFTSTGGPTPSHAAPTLSSLERLDGPLQDRLVASLSRGLGMGGGLGGALGGPLVQDLPPTGGLGCTVKSAQQRQPFRALHPRGLQRPQWWWGRMGMGMGVGVGVGLQAAAGAWAAVAEGGVEGGGPPVSWQWLTQRRGSSPPPRLALALCPVAPAAGAGAGVGMGGPWVRAKAGAPAR